MSDKQEKRKQSFKPKHESTTERVRKQVDLIRKERRSATILAKRINVETSDSFEDEDDNFNESDVNESIGTVKVRKHECHQLLCFPIDCCGLSVPTGRRHCREA